MSRRGYEEEPGWFSKNWGWCLPLGGCLGCLGLVALVGMLTTGGLFWLTDRLDLDDEALRIAAEHPAVVEALGEPVEKGWTQNISMHSKDGETEAEMTFGIRGPIGAGTLRTRGVRQGDDWVLEFLEFQREGSDVWIDLKALPDPGNEQVRLPEAVPSGATS